jgi:hypothetical protein
MLEIPIKPVPSQNLSIVLDKEICKINIYVRGDHLYFDLIVGTTSITRCTIALNAVPLVKQNYLGFAANFIFIDTHGRDNPVYTGLGTRYKLIYLTEEENAQLF